MGSRLKNGVERIFPNDAMLYHMIGVWVTQVYVFIKSHLMVYFSFVHFTVVNFILKSTEVHDLLQNLLENEIIWWMESGMDKWKNMWKRKYTKMLTLEIS